MAAVQAQASRLSTRVATCSPSAGNRTPCPRHGQRSTEWVDSRETVSTSSPSCSRAALRGKVSCQAYNAQQRLADEEYMQEYADLKKTLLDNTRKAGAGIAAYMLLTVDGETAACAFLGMGFSTLYLQWLYRDVDNVKPTDRVPMMEARQVANQVQRVLAMWLASYRHSLQPRLLVPVALAALVGAYNQLAEVPLTGFQEVALLFGFLSYKFAFIFKLVDELSPKEYVQESSRPMIEKVAEEELELDRWGRPRKPQYTMPTEALPEDVDPNNPGLLPSLLVKTAMSVDDDGSVPAAPAVAVPTAVPQQQQQQQQQGNGSKKKVV